MGADHHPRRRLLGREAGAHREAAADALGGRHDVGDDAVMLIGIELPGAGDAALDLVEYQHQIMLVAGGAKARQELVRAGRMPPSPWIGSTQEAGGILVDRRQRRVEIVELRRTLKPGQQRREAVDHLGLVGGADRPHRPPVEGVGEGDEVVLVRVALGVMIAPRGLDRAFDRLDAGIGEEHSVGEGEVGSAAWRTPPPAASRRGSRRASASPPGPGSPWSDAGGRARGC